MRWRGLLRQKKPLHHASHGPPPLQSRGGPFTPRSGISAAGPAPAPAPGRRRRRRGRSRDDGRRARRSASRRRAGSACVAVATKQRRETRRPRWLIRSLGWKWPDSSGRGLGRVGLVAQQQAVHLGLRDDLAAAMVGEARIVIAGDPGPARRGGEPGQHGARRGRQPVAAVAVVEAVAEAPDLLRRRSRRRSRPDRPGSRSNRRAAASARAVANQLAFSRWRSATSRARRAGQNSAPCGSAISS